MSTIVIGSDHGGFELKEQVVALLKMKDYMVLDRGCYASESCDYPDFAKSVSKIVYEGEADFGILICKSGIGMSMVANKQPGIRAALCYQPETAKLARAHNDANILVLGSQFTPFTQVEKMIPAFIETQFEGDRHQRRIDKMMEE